MKHFKKLLAASLLLACSGFAHATLIDTIELQGPVTVDHTHPFRFEHDFTDNAYTPGFDTIQSAFLSITLKDVGGSGQGGSESYSLTIDSSGVVLLQGKDLNNGARSFDALGITGGALHALHLTGKLAFTLEAGYGDYQFVRSTLEAQYTPGVAPVDVPEPFSVTLVGIGLAAIGAARRKA